MDLPFNGNNATLLRSVRFQAQVSAITAVPPDLGCLYEAGVDLYYNDGAGNQVRITQGGAVTGATGTITGLPSGTASAAFVSASGTFVFQQATSTAANMDVGTLILRYPGSYPTPAGNFIALEAPTSLATGFAFTLPNNTPSVNQSALVSDTSGHLSYMNPDDIGVAMTATGANAIANTRTRATGSSTVGVGGIAISSSSGNFSTSSAFFVAVTNLQITITTTGRPIYLQLIPDPIGASVGSGIFSYVGTDTAGDGKILINNETTAVSLGVTSILAPGAGIRIPPTGVSGMDFQPAGTYTYQVYAENLNSGHQTFVNYALLVAYEL